jgi:hypothetical protein
VTSAVFSLPLKGIDLMKKVMSLALAAFVLSIFAIGCGEPAKKDPPKTPPEKTVPVDPKTGTTPK